MATGAICSISSADSPVGSFFPGLIALLVALLAELGGIGQREWRPISQAQHFHVATVMADPATFIPRAELIMELQCRHVTLKTV